MMKVKRLLSAFVAVAIVLTTMVSFSTVVSAIKKEDRPVPEFTITFTPDESANLEEGQYGWKVKATLSNYGELTAIDEDYSGIKFNGYQIDFGFRDSTTFVKDGTTKQIKTDLPYKPSHGYDSDIDTLVYLNAAFSPDQAYPVEAGTVSDEFTLFESSFVTSKAYFTLDVKCLCEINDFHADGYMIIPDGDEYGHIYGNWIPKYNQIKINGVNPGYATLAMPVGTAPVEEAKVDAKLDFENFADTINSVYSAENGYKYVSKSTAVTDAETPYNTYEYSSFNVGVGGFPQSNWTVNASSATETSFTIPEKKAYQGIQGDSGFKNVTMFIRANDIMGTANAVADNMALWNKDDGSKVMRFWSTHPQMVHGNLNLITEPVSDAPVEYGFSFAVTTFRETTHEGELSSTNVGGFGEIKDSSINGEYIGMKHDLNDKIVRARLDKAYGFAVYNETAEEWTTIATADALGTNWHDVKYIVNPVTKTYTVYLDGVVKGTFPFSNPDAITAVDAIEFNGMRVNNQYAYGTSDYYLDDIYAFEAPVTVTFVDESGSVLAVKKIHAGDDVTLPTLKNAQISTTQSLTNITQDTTIVCTATAVPAVYTEDFENISFKEDGTVTTESENPLKEIIIPSQTFTAYTSNSGATETYNTILDSGTYTVWRNNNANGNYEASSTFTLDSKAIMMKVGQYPTFKFEEASSGVVKVSYDILTVERRRGNGTDSAIMGIYDSATRNYAVKVGDIAYNAEGKKQNAWYAYDGATSQTMCDAKYNTWQKMEYYIDLDNSEYVVKLGGTVYGPYAFRNTVNKVDAITSNVTQHLGMYVMDNLEVETLSVAPKAELIGNDGSSLGMVALSAGTDANPPVAPEIKGKKFAGWYEDAEGTKKVTFAAFTGDKVYAKYLDKVLVETFDTTTIDYTTGKLTGSAFDVQFGLNANNLPEEANAAIKTSSGRDSNALYVDIASKQHATKIVYSFPEVSEGVVKVSFDINIVEWLNTGDGPVDIGSLITGTAASHKTAARLIGAQNNWKLFTNDDEENLVDIGMSGGNHWNTVTYYADLDNQTYKVQVGDTISGPYNFKNTVDSVDGIYFGDVRTGWQGQYYLDNLTVDTDYHDPVVTFNNADGTKIADVTVVNGKVTVPSYTVPAGKSFIGWSDGTNIVTKFDEIEEDMTLTMSVKDAVALRETFDSFRTDLIADAESATGQIVAADGTTITDNALTSGYTLNGYAYKKSHFFVQADGNDNVLGINNDGSLNYDALKFAFAPIKGENKANISFDYKLSSVYNAFSVNNNYDNKYGMAIVKGKDTNGNEKIAALIQYTNTGYLTDAEGNVLNEGMGLVVFKNNGDGQINAEDWVTIVPYTGTPSDGWDWNNLELVFDVKAQTFDVLLNGTNKGTFPFKDTVDNVSVVEFNMSHAGHFGRNASLFVDDVTVVENKSEVFNPFPNEEPTPVSILAYANGKLVVNSPSDGKLYIVTKAANGEVSTAAVHTVTANTEADFNFATGETAYLWSAVMDPICDPFTISQ